MHSYCHNLSCRSRLSPRYILGIGLEDGENAERFWSRLPYAAHTRKMRSEIRRDFISLHANLLCQSSFFSLADTLNLKLSRAEKSLDDLMKIFTDKQKAPIAYQTFIEEMENTKRDSTNDLTSNRRASDVEIKRRNIDSIARTIIRIELKSNSRMGTKKSAMIARALKSSRECLSESIDEFNATFPSESRLEFSKVLLRCKSSLLSDEMENNSLFWKCIEQLKMTHRDLIDGQASLLRISENITSCQSLAIDHSIIQATNKRLTEIQSVRMSLAKLNSNSRALQAKYRSYLSQVKLD